MWKIVAKTKVFIGNKSQFAMNHPYAISVHSKYENSRKSRGKLCLDPSKRFVTDDKHDITQEHRT